LPHKFQVIGNILFIHIVGENGPHWDPWNTKISKIIYTVPLFLVSKWWPLSPIFKNIVVI